MNSPLARRLWGENEEDPMAIDSRVVWKYKPRTEKTRLQEELTVMILNEDGGSELYRMTRSEVLNMSNSDARELPTTPFGEMKMKDLRMLDPNVSFGSEPKVIVRTLCALVSLNPIHAFVMPHRVLMIVPDGADGILQSIKSNLKAILQTAVDQDQEASTSSPSHKDDQDNESANAETIMEDDASTTKGDQTLPQSISVSRVEPEPHVLQTERSGGSNDGEEYTRPLLHNEERRRFSLEPRSTEEIEPPLKRRLLRRTRSFRSHDEMPFQFVALELLFDTAALSFKKDVDYLRLAHDQVKTIVAANELVTKVNALRSKLVATRETIEAFISDDKDLGLFSFNSIIRYYSEPESEDALDAWEPYEIDVNEVEELAEDFVSRLDDAVNQLDMLKFAIAELTSNFQHEVDVRRESLMKLLIRMQGITCLGAGPTLVTGLFGMNLTSGLMVEDTTNFWITFGVLMCIFIIGTCVFVVFSERILVGPDGGAGDEEGDME